MIDFNLRVMQNMVITHGSAYWVLFISVSLEPHTVSGEYWGLKFFYTELKEIIKGDRTFWNLCG